MIRTPGGRSAGRSTEVARLLLAEARRGDAGITRRYPLSSLRASVSIWIASLLSVLAVSGASLLGLLAVARDEEKMHRRLTQLVSFAVGALLGGVALHLLPEAAAELGVGNRLGFLFLLGFLGFFALEKYLWLHEHEPDPVSTRDRRPLVTLNLVGDGVHNFIDGMIIAAGYSADFSLGLTTTVAVMLHELPQELGDFGVLVYGGLSVRKALIYNFLSALTATAGAVVALGIGSLSPQFAAQLLPFAAGGLLYIAASDLIPELHRQRTPADFVQQVLLILAGLAAVSLPSLFF